MERFEMVPVGRVVSTRSEVSDDGWDAEHAAIELLPPFDERAWRGLEAFSHCVVITLLDRAVGDLTRMLRRPRGNPDWPEVGIFAQRVKDRPNRLGLTTCRIVGVDGMVLRVGGLDAVDGTPVLDVKPHLVEFGARGTVHQPSWATELMSGYW
ncbi:MAG: SAM-dependent methyltransferase [Actinomycetota bacterium]